jgi:hypothetical protein
MPEAERAMTVTRGVLGAAGLLACAKVLVADELSERGTCLERAIIAHLRSLPPLPEPLGRFTPDP